MLAERKANRPLDLQTAAEIDQQVEKVLRGLGRPEPPLDLAAVRELLRLDRGFYSSADTDLLRERVSRLIVAGKQVLARPGLLLDAVKKLDLKALYLPDRRRILLDQELPPLKHRWNEAHEIGHSILPWHAELMHGDDSHTLTPGCHEEVENEANYAAGRLLFVGDHFVRLARDLEPSIASIHSLRGIFGNTLTSTLWRYVETAYPERPMLAVVSAHPRRSGTSFDPSLHCRHFVASPAFRERFGQVNLATLFRRIARYCGSQRGGPLGEGEVLLADLAGDEHVFRFETFFNGHDALTFGAYARPRNLAHAVTSSGVPAPP